MDSSMTAAQRERFEVLSRNPSRSPDEDAELARIVAAAPGPLPAVAGPSPVALARLEALRAMPDRTPEEGEEMARLAHAAPPLQPARPGDGASSAAMTYRADGSRPTVDSSDLSPDAERLRVLRANQARTPAEEAEMERLFYPVAADPEAPVSEPIVFAHSDTAFVSLGFEDDHDKDLGPMPMPGPGQARSSNPNIATVTVSTDKGQVMLRVDGLNPGKAEISYRQGEVALTIPIEVVARAPKKVVVRDVNRQRIIP